MTLVIIKTTSGHPRISLFFSVKHRVFLKLLTANSRDCSAQHFRRQTGKKTCRGFKAPVTFGAYQWLEHPGSGVIRTCQSLSAVVLYISTRWISSVQSKCLVGANCGVIIKSWHQLLAHNTYLTSPQIQGFDLAVQHQISVYVHEGFTGTLTS